MNIRTIAVAAAGSGLLAILFSVPALADPSVGKEAIEADDNAAAVERYRSAAERGDGGAASQLGWRFERGLGVQEDLVQAYAWYSVANAWGELEHYGAYLEVLDMHLYPYQVEEAHKLAHAYYEKYVAPF